MQKAKKFLFTLIPALQDFSHRPSLFSKVADGVLANVAEFGRTKDKVKILEFGAGTCPLSMEILQKYAQLDDANKTPMHVVCMDPNKNWLTIGQRKIERFLEKNKLKDWVSFTFSNISSDQLKDLGNVDGSFDIVMSTLTFHHSDREGKLKVLRDLLKLLNSDHGKLIVGDFFQKNGPSLKERIAYNMLYYSDSKHIESNLELPNLISSAGFKDVSNMKIEKFWDAVELDLFQATKEGEVSENVPVLNQ